MFREQPAALELKFPALLAELKKKLKHQIPIIPHTHSSTAVSFQTGIQGYRNSEIQHLNYNDWQKRTPPIIPKWSCRVKSMSLPLKNHLKMGCRVESLDTSHGKTMLSPTVASILKGGTVILVGSAKKKEDIF